MTPGRGVNPQLNSLLQTPGTDDRPALWGQFHAAHVNHIADTLNEILPDAYVAYSEQSLIEIPYEVQRPVAVVIRAREGSGLGEVVTRIEVLSPSNKPRGAHFVAYLQKRIEALESGVPLVEVDYLHESPIIVQGHPVYPRDPDAYPYTIAVSDPRPTWEQGRVKVYGIGVDQPLPVVPIPLRASDSVALDFEAIYQHTFRARRYHTLVDVRALPARFELYSAGDRTRIRQMLTERSP
jgi:hypothetical protein